MSAPLIPIPPGYICLSREDYDSIMERLNNVKACAFDDLKALNDEVAYLKKVLEEKQDEILTLQETIDEEKKEKQRMLTRIDHELMFNGLWEKRWNQVREYLTDAGMLSDFDKWMDTQCPTRRRLNNPVQRASPSAWVRNRRTGDYEHPQML